MPDGRPAVGLRGRRRECEALDRLVESALAGQSRVLVLRGEAGIGKSALLGYVAERAIGCRIVRGAGVEGEMELAFAGLHQLCVPLLDRLDHLPGPHREALTAAFGLKGGPAPDRFLVGLAVLGLFSHVAEEDPLVLAIDDAHWQDRASAQTLAFVGRRLLAERIAMVFAVREPSDTAELAPFDQLRVGPLADEDARAILASELPGLMDVRVRERIVAEARGNPLALRELRRGLTPAELAGGFGLLPRTPVGSRIEQHFLHQIEALPIESRRLLLLAAAEPVGDVTLLWRAGSLLGLGADAAIAAEGAGLVSLGSRVRFRHPMVRSAAYRSATATERRQIHGALAAATDPDIDPDRRAWHRAEAAAGLDEDVAQDLERCADRARRRGGVAAAAAFLARATELTPEPARRGVRALAAARAKFDAAAPHAAFELLATAETTPLDGLHRARLERLRAQLTFARTPGGAALEQLLGAAKRLEGFDAGLARETYLEALRAAISCGRLIQAPGVRAAAEAAGAAPRAADPPRVMDLLLDGLAIRFTEGYSAGVAPLRRALDAFRGENGVGDGEMRWLWLACPVAPEPVAPDLWDDETWHELAARAARLARAAGALTVLPLALTYRAVVHVHAGELATAAALVDEAAAISEATGNPSPTYTAQLLAAWRGRETEALELIETGVQSATAVGEGRALGSAAYATAVLYNALGAYEAALAAAQRACEYEDLGLFGWALTELVEAAVRSGARDAALAAVANLEERTGVAGTDWALGIRARSLALVGQGADVEALYQEAIERLGRTRIAVHLARAHLVYGEWLRREHRRLDARRHLRAAHDMLASMGLEGFAERARRELSATGETVRKRGPDTRDVLTSQEAQIARLAGERQTNAEIAAQLFISPRTVEYHLRKVFTKLGVNSRRELRGAFSRGHHAVPAA